MRADAQRGTCRTRPRVLPLARRHRGRRESRALTWRITPAVTTGNHRQTRTPQRPRHHAQPNPVRLRQFLRPNPQAARLQLIQVHQHCPATVMAAPPQPHLPRAHARPEQRQDVRTRRPQPHPQLIAQLHHAATATRPNETTAANPSANRKETSPPAPSRAAGAVKTGEHQPHHNHGAVRTHEQPRSELANKTTV